MNWKTQISAITLMVPSANASTAMANSTLSYIIGSVIALFIMGYLIYSLLRPDKF